MPHSRGQRTAKESGGLIMDQSTIDADATETGKAGPDFDWENCWYPVSFLEDLPRDRPSQVSIYDTGLVLFFDGSGQLNCLRDLCPHRMARLSDGQIVDGRLECLYHGWQFDGAGDCQLIPQMLEGRDYPIRSCVRRYALEIVDGIVWVWAGAADAADASLIPAGRASGAEGVTAVTFQMDLPYDQSYLIENVIDVAHIHIAHHGVRGGGLRQAASPLKFEIIHSGVDGIRATYRHIGLHRDEDAPEMGAAHVAFVAPNLVRYTSEYADADLVAGLDLFSLPMGKGRCRLLYRKYSNFTGLLERMKPRWLEHQSQILILEQDMGVVVGQHREIEAADRPLSKSWLPIKTSDRLVVEYRRWLDRHGAALPFYRGFTTARNSGVAPDEVNVPQDRHRLHTAICSSCQRLLRRIDLGIRALAALSAAAAAVAILSSGVGLRAALVGVALLSLLAIAGLRHARNYL